LAVRYDLVSKEACALFDDMVECEGWSQADEVMLRDVHEITAKVSKSSSSSSYINDNHLDSVVLFVHYLDMWFWESNNLASGRQE